MGWAKVGFQVSYSKIDSTRVNNNTRIDFVFCVLTMGNLLLPTPVYFTVLNYDITCAI